MAFKGPRVKKKMMKASGMETWVKRDMPTPDPAQQAAPGWICALVKYGM
jgi:hypothetical protein